MKHLIQVSVSDFKLIFRDPSLRVFLFLPFLIYVVNNFGLPYLVSEFEAVNEFVPYVLILSTVQVTQMFGFIYSMVLIEEKETEVSKVYGITPVSKIWFTLFRMIIPFIITILFTWVILLIQPFYTLAAIPSLIFSILISLLLPVYVMGVVLSSKNKMEGMIWVKVFNIIVILPALAFFIPPRFAPLFGIFPNHWIFQGLLDLILQQNILVPVMIAFVYLSITLIWILNRFTKVHFT